MYTTSKSVYAWFSIFCFIILAAVVGHGVNLVRTREQAMNDFCKAHYGPTFNVADWHDGEDHHTFSVSCMVTASAVRLP